MTLADEVYVQKARPLAPADLTEIDLVCLSHLRWNFIYQRPQHLLSRCAQERRVFFVEEPVFNHAGPAHLAVSVHSLEAGVQPVMVVVPHLPGQQLDEQTTPILRTLLDEFFARSAVRHYFLWYYTPAALNFTRQLTPLVTIYDCMDELSLFKGAAPELHRLELELFHRANVVFTGGCSLYEAKRQQHPNIHCFPSSIDVKHFAQARDRQPDPFDQVDIPHPRLGYFGAIDERLDLEMLAQAAQQRPDWHFVFLGPVVKIDPRNLPQHPNIHYLGLKPYSELPGYLAGWDVALLPFALNDATRFISPTKTPEYLAGGKRTVSTPIRDVIAPYGEQHLVEIAATPEEFVAAVDRVLTQGVSPAWLAQVDSFLKDLSWDQTWAQMKQLIYQALEIGPSIDDDHDQKHDREAFTGQLEVVQSQMLEVE